MPLDTGPNFFPEPNSEGLNTIELERISLAKLLEEDQQEAGRLFGACRDKGFCYLDLTTHEKGVELIEGAQEIHETAKEAFRTTQIAKKREFKSRPPETGLLDTGYDLGVHPPPFATG